MIRSLHICILPVACLFGLTGNGYAEETSVAVWDKAARVDVSVGYHDNLTRSAIAPESSGYIRTVADASLLRFSSADRLLVVFLFGDDTRYFEGPVDYEQFLSATTQFSMPAGENGKAGAELNYFYQHQICDVSETEADLYRILVLGHGLTAKSYWQQALGERWFIKAQGAALRQIYEQELDDYWEGAVNLRLTRHYGIRSEVSAGTQLLRRDYDTRNQFDALGNPLPASDLVYMQQEIDGEWKHYFDADGKWRLKTRVGYMQNEDNGSGYFDYTRILVWEQLRWKPGDWEIKAAVRAGWYRYALQRAGNDRRERQYIITSLRVERYLGTHWRAYVGAEYERSESNDPLDDYHDWFVESGLGYEF